MTAVICIFDPKTGEGAIAADSCWTSSVTMRGRPKIRKLDAYYVASSSSMLGSIFVEQRGPWDGIAEGEPANPYATPADLRRFASLWRAWCTERGHTEQLHGSRDYPAFFLLIGPGGIFQVTSDGELLHHIETAVAIGAGAQVAIGAAYACTSLLGPEGLLSPADIARVAIGAAIKYCDGCEGPVQVVRVDVGDIPYTEDLTE